MPLKYNNILRILEKNINLLIFILLAHIMHTLEDYKILGNFKS